jgi:hypothetical protein
MGGQLGAKRLVRFARNTHYTAPRLEAACTRALHVGALSYQSVKSILSTGLDRTPVEEQTALALPQNHEHVRGGEYYAAAASGE